MHRAGHLLRYPASQLIDSLLDPAAYPHAVGEVTLVETHISWLLLAGAFAYKVKKPLKLDFLDFSTLERRKFYCEEEIRLNRPWAPAIYLDVVPITIADGQPHVAGDGRPVEFAVRMRRFDERLRLDRQLEDGDLSAADMKELGHAIAARHEGASRASMSRQRYLRLTREFIFDNFDALDGAIEPAQLGPLREWTLAELERVENLIAERFDEGFVRDCHGDLHLANLVRLPDGITTFDCIEFSDGLRQIDVVCDIAFLVMDLVERGRHDLAAHFLNRYLERCGDYPGVALLSLFFVYRCLVRAKVAVIRSRERDVKGEAEADLAEAHQYCDMAARQAAPRPTLLIVMTGLSGSGKTRVSNELMAAMPAIRIRSDVERKRLYGLAETESSGSAVGGGIYTAQAGRRVYARLMDLAREVLLSGHNVIVDAAFLRRSDRRAALELAEQCGCTAVLVEVSAPASILRERVLARAADASEARLDVLEHQLATAEPLDVDERGRAISFENTGGVDVAALMKGIEQQAKYGLSDR